MGRRPVRARRAPRRGVRPVPFRPAQTGKWFASMADIRESQDSLLERERQLRAVYECAPVGVCETDRAGCFLRVNPKFAELTGHPAAALIGRSIFDLTHPADADADRRLYGIRVVQDASTRKLAEEALRDSQRRLREENRRKDEFLAMLAHELRNPMAPIRNTLELLKMMDATPGTPLSKVRAIMERQVRL